ncbi:hypothetical protein C8Q78DRAFT_1060316 [Trametes maxima]|nr:hypothetical protein C8Q78DRAFT_1060316 [Trametes maxima]
MDEWDKKQAKKRKQKAQRSPEVEIGVKEYQMAHDDRTMYELVRGVRELNELYPKDRRPKLDFDRTVKRLRPVAAAAAVTATERATASRKSASPQEAGPSVELQPPPEIEPSPEAEAPPSVPSSPSPSPPPPRTRPTRPLPRRSNTRRSVYSPTIPDSDVGETRQSERRATLQQKWAKRLNGSASVTLVNEINSEETPYLVEGFRYIERGYVRAEDVPLNSQLNADYLVSCDCDDRCYEAEQCGCQGPSEMTDDAGYRIFAYTKDRLFNFQLPSGMEVIECNESCSCDAGCPNRVAQLPRDIPIEIFRTRECGWGARATIPLRKGKVAGIYTGQLIRREEADRRIDERRSYIFDLDFREGADDEEDTERFSVDGHAYGNWTRFVNHSCEPNMRVFPVVWDTIPELNQPYLAFVATEYIPARTELTIDYDPKAGEEARVSKQKGRPETPPGARECKCGTDSCRGWVRV